MPSLPWLTWDDLEEILWLLNAGGPTVWIGRRRVRVHGKEITWKGHGRNLGEFFSEYDPDLRWRYLLNFIRSLWRKLPTPEERLRFAELLTNRLQARMNMGDCGRWEAPTLILPALQTDLIWPLELAVERVPELIEGYANGLLPHLFSRLPDLSTFHLPVPVVYSDVGQLRQDVAYASILVSFPYRRPGKVMLEAKEYGLRLPEEGNWNLSEFARVVRETREAIDYLCRKLEERVNAAMERRGTIHFVGKLAQFLHKNVPVETVKAI